MNKMQMSASAVVLLMAMAVLPMSGAQDEIPTTNYADISLGFPYSSDFDADDGGWTASDVPEPEPRPEPQDSSWAWGAPTSGPGAAYSGNNVWATNLTGAYHRYECGALLTPPIDLTGASSASVSFMQWRHMEQSSFSSAFVYDGGRLYVSTDGGATITPVEPDQGYDGRLSTYSRRCLDDVSSGEEGIGGPPGSTPPAPTYTPMSADLSAFAGQTVQFLIGFGTDCCLHRDGWYIDDFTVTIDGVSTVEDFESDDGGFTIVSTAQPPAPPLGWSWDVPSEGPVVEDAMWSTNPHGDYGHKECAWIESPPIALDLVPAGAGVVNARLTWEHWFRSNSLYAAGVVQVGVPGPDGVEYEYVVPESGYDGSASGSYSDQLVACLGPEAEEAAYSGLDHSSSKPMEAQLVDLTPYVGQVVTVRFVFASAWSNLNPSTQEGWYVDDVDVEMRLTVDGPDVEQFLDDTTGGSTEAPGWSSGGTDSSWAYGVVTEAGPEGDTVYATNLAGDHNEYECSYIESPAVPGLLLVQDSNLEFNHWYEMYHSSFSGNAWNGGVVMVSTDDGATWEYVASDAYTSPAPYSRLNDCLQSFDPNTPEDPMVFSGDQLFYSPVSMDLSAYAGAQTIKVRFVFGAGISIEDLGWYIESVELGGISLL